MTTIGRMVESAATRHAERVAIEDGDLHLSYPELAARVRTAARALMALGVLRGDRVAIWAPNGWRWIVAALGAHAAGAAVVPINTRYKGEEAAFVLAKSRARVLFASTDFLDTDYVAMLRRTGAALPSLEAVVVTNGQVPERARSFEGFLADASRVSTDAAAARAAAIQPDDASDVMFTSGTTGRPKGVIASHAQTLRAFQDWAEIVGLVENDRYLVALPFFHSFGYKAGWLACLLAGATILPHAVFDVRRILDRVARERVTVLPGPPALYQSILASPDLGSRDLSSLRLAVTGAAVVPVELVRRMRDVLGFRTVLTGYGLTEATGVSTLCRRDDDPETVATTSGRAIPGVSLKVVDDSGQEVPPGTPGEILIGGYGVMRGYFEDPEETARALTPDGWLKTGDVGVVDARGYVRITDRKKDMFIVGGFNAYPAEIEAVLLRHEAIAQAAVVGAPDERLGEVGVAYVVARPGARVSAEEIVAFCRDRMANYKVPRRVVIVDALPTNATGKVLKYALRERARMEHGCA